MSSSRYPSRYPSSYHAEPGPLADDEQHECAHGGILFPSDPAPEHVVPCTQPAVYRVPVPDAMGTWAFCSWHLARVLEDHEPDVRAQLLLNRVAHEYIDDDALVRLEDVPPEQERGGFRWVRIGLDQRGEAHYVAPEPGLLVVVDEHLEATEPIHELRGRPFAKWLEFVAKRRGWAAFDDRVTPDDGGGDGGD